MSLELVVIIIGVCLVFQAFFAGSEISLVSCDKVKMKALAEAGSKSAQLVMSSVERIERFLSTALVGINLSLIISTIVLTFYFEDRYGEGGEYYTVLILSPLIVILGQVVPKAIFQRHRNTLILKVIYPLWLVSKVFSPVLIPVDALTKWMLRVMGGTENPFLTREELLHAIAQNGRDKKFGKKESMIRRVFDFSETASNEVMIPLVHLVALSETATVSEAVKLIGETGHSRIPIFCDRIDNITGILHHFFLLDADPGAAVKEFARDPFYVPESKTVDELLDEMKSSLVGMAIVVDEYGGSIGGVTIEDILEEVVGEIEDEYDTGARLWREEKKNEYLINPKIELELLSDELGVSVPEGDYETLSGFLLYELGTIPRVGDSIEYGSLHFYVTKANPRAIEEVRLVVKK